MGQFPRVTFIVILTTKASITAGAICSGGGAALWRNHRILLAMDAVTEEERMDHCRRFDRRGSGDDDDSQYCSAAGRIRWIGAF